MIIFGQIKNLHKREYFLLNYYDEMDETGAHYTE